MSFFVQMSDIYYISLNF